MTVIFACSPPPTIDSRSPGSSISSISLGMPEPAAIVRMPPVSGARGSFRTSSPVHIDSNDGGLDIDEYGEWKPIQTGPFGGEYPHTRSEFDPSSPRLLGSSTDHTASPSSQPNPMHGSYIDSESAKASVRTAAVRVSLPIWHHPLRRSNDIPIDATNDIEQPTSPSHFFVRHHYPTDSDLPMPKHYTYLDRNRTGDMSQPGAVSPPMRSMVMTQPPTPKRTMEEILVATEKTKTRIEELIQNQRERSRIERLADEGKVDFRVPVRGRGRSSSMSRLSGHRRLA